jgi:hypothetical protein
MADPWPFLAAFYSVVSLGALRFSVRSRADDA